MKNRSDESPEEVPEDDSKNIEGRDPTEALIQSARRGDYEAWTKLDHRFRGVLALFMRGKIPSPARRRFDTEDLLQSTFLSAFKELDSYQDNGEGSFLAWLTRILQNRLKSRMRGINASKRDARREQPYTESNEGIAGKSVAESPSQVLASSEYLALLVQAIAELPVSYRQVATMHLLDKKTLSQIADELDVSAATVGRRLAQSIVVIRRRIH